MEATNCTQCGITFREAVPEERRHHAVLHAERIMAEAVHGPIEAWPSREAKKKAGWALVESMSRADQLTGTLQVIRAHFDRSIDPARGVPWRQHPPFPVYAKAWLAANGNLLKPDVFTELKGKFGSERSPELATGCSVWRIER